MYAIFFRKPKSVYELLLAKIKKETTPRTLTAQETQIILNEQLKGFEPRATSKCTEDTVTNEITHLITMKSKGISLTVKAQKTDSDFVKTYHATAEIAHKHLKQAWVESVFGENIKLAQENCAKMAAIEESVKDLSAQTSTIRSFR